VLVEVNVSVIGPVIVIVDVLVNVIDAVIVNVDVRASCSAPACTTRVHGHGFVPVHEHDNDHDNGNDHVNGGVGLAPLGRRRHACA
jgi:hypothetical protein